MDTAISRAAYLGMDCSQHVADFAHLRCCYMAENITEEMNHAAPPAGLGQKLGGPPEV